MKLKKTLATLLALGAIAGCSKTNVYEHPFLTTHDEYYEKQVKKLDRKEFIGEVVDDSILVFDGKHSSTSDILYFSSLFLPVFKPSNASYQIILNTDINGETTRLRFKDYDNAKKLKKLEEEINPGDKVKINCRGKGSIYLDKENGIEKIR